MNPLTSRPVTPAPTTPSPTTTQPSMEPTYLPTRSPTQSPICIDNQFEGSVYEFIQQQKVRNDYNDNILYALFVLNLGIFLIMIYGCLSYKKSLNNHQIIKKGYVIAEQDVEDNE